jgi:uncharacterized membrane protein YiaA
VTKYQKDTRVGGKGYYFQALMTSDLGYQETEEVLLSAFNEMGI